MKIKIFTTGGSIDKFYSTRKSTFVVGEPQVQNILQEANASLDVEIESLFKKGIMRFAATGDMSGLPDKVEMPPVKWIVPDFSKK